MTKWFASGAAFSFWMFLHWVAGNEFERGDQMAVALAISTIFAIFTFVMCNLLEKGSK